MCLKQVVMGLGVEVMGWEEKERKRGGGEENDSIMFVPLMVYY